MYPGSSLKLLPDPWPLYGRIKLSASMVIDATSDLRPAYRISTAAGIVQRMVLDLVVRRLEISVRVGNVRYYAVLRDLRVNDLLVVLPRLLGCISSPAFPFRRCYFLSTNRSRN